MRIVILVFLFLFFVGCKQDKSELLNKNHSEKKEIDNALKSQFIVDLEVIVSNDEVFEMFYQDYDNHKYTWKTKIKKKIKGSDKLQTIRFKMPETYFPKSLRFDFGDNPETKYIKFVSLKMTYEDLNITINPAEFGAFFVSNSYVTYNKNTGEITTKKIKSKYDPYFDSKPVFKQRLKIEAR